MSHMQGSAVEKAKLEARKKGRTCFETHCQSGRRREREDHRLHGLFMQGRQSFHRAGPGNNRPGKPAAGVFPAGEHRRADQAGHVATDERGLMITDHITLSLLGFTGFLGPTATIERALVCDTEGR